MLFRSRHSGSGHDVIQSQLRHQIVLLQQQRHRLAYASSCTHHSHTVVTLRVTKWTKKGERRDKKQKQNYGALPFKLCWSNSCTYGVFWPVRRQRIAWLRAGSWQERGKRLWTWSPFTSKANWWTLELATWPSPGITCRYGNTPDGIQMCWARAGLWWLRIGSYSWPWIMSAGTVLCEPTQLYNIVTQVRERQYFSVLTIGEDRLCHQISNFQCSKSPAVLDETYLVLFGRVFLHTAVWHLCNWVIKHTHVHTNT